MLSIEDKEQALVYLCKKVLGLKKRLNITEEHMMRLMEIEQQEWAQIAALGAEREKFT